MHPKQYSVSGGTNRPKADSSSGNWTGAVSKLDRPSSAMGNRDPTPPTPPPTRKSIPTSTAAARRSLPPKPPVAQRLAVKERSRRSHQLDVPKLSLPANDESTAKKMDIGKIWYVSNFPLESQSDSQLKRMQPGIGILRKSLTTSDTVMTSARHELPQSFPVETEEAAGESPKRRYSHHHYSIPPLGKMSKSSLNSYGNMTSERPVSSTYASTERPLLPSARNDSCWDNTDSPSSKIIHHPGPDSLDSIVRESEEQLLSWHKEGGRLPVYSDERSLSIRSDFFESLLKPIGSNSGFELDVNDIDTCFSLNYESMWGDDDRRNEREDCSSMVCREDDYDGDTHFYTLDPTLCQGTEFSECQNRHPANSPRRCTVIKRSVSTSSTSLRSRPEKQPAAASEASPNPSLQSSSSHYSCPAASTPPSTCNHSTRSKKWAVMATKKEVYVSFNVIHFIVFVLLGCIAYLTCHNYDVEKIVHYYYNLLKKWFQ